MDEKERLKELRKSLGLTLEKFGERIGLKKTVLSEYENGRKNMTPRTKLAICREFGVSERWLETGEGEMFQAETEEGRHLKKLIDEALANRDDKFRTALLEIILQLDLDELETVKRYAERYLLPALGEDADPDGHLPGTDSGDDRFAGSFAGSAEPAADPGETLPEGSGLSEGPAEPAAEDPVPDGSEPLSVKEEIEIAKKVEDYRRQLRIEKRVEARSSALSGGEEKKEA